jgi:hypothetical protein
MHRLTTHPCWLLLVAAAIGPALAQAPAGDSQAYVPAVPSASNVGSYGGYYGGGGHASTLEEGAMNGMANVISAAGDYNLATSAAAVNLTEAQRNDIQNRQMNTQAYFDIRAINRASRAQAAGPKPTMEQLTRIARQGAPEGLQSGQFDPVSGQIAWPKTLLDEIFGLPRATVDQLFVKRAAQGDLGISDHSALRQAVESMSAQLKAHIKDVKPQDYVDARKFLQNVMYTAAQRSL